MPGHRMQSLVKRTSAWAPASSLGITVVMLLACGTSGPETPPSGAPSPQHAEHSPAAAPTPSPPPVPSPPPAPSRPATACAGDGDCGFADPCQPVRCVASPARAACGQPATPSGSCVCLEGRCALRPSRPCISQQPCKDTGDCSVEVATAACEPGIVPDAGFRVRFSGPTCWCSPRDHRCHLQWFDPVPCASTDDCWIDNQPVEHAIRRPARLKGRTFRGCVDGELVPACVAGRCTLDALTC